MNTKTFIINLDRQVDRKKRMESQLKNAGISNYEFFPAVDGEKLNINPFPLPDNIDRKHLGEKFRKHFNNNEIACLQSHINVIKKARELELDYVTILEDDIVLCVDWNDRLEKLYKLTPKSWQHIYLSGEPNEHTHEFRPLNLAPFLHIEKSINTMGAFSYVLKKDSYDLVINHLFTMTLPVDDVINNLIVGNYLKSYTFYPFLTYHENEVPSSIWDESIWKQEYYHEHESKRFFVRRL